MIKDCFEALRPGTTRVTTIEEADALILRVEEESKQEQLQKAQGTIYKFMLA